MAHDLNLTEKLEKLNAIGVALSAERSLRKLLHMIVREARALTNCDAGSLYIVTGDQLSFEVSQSAFLGESKFTPFTFPIDKSRISGYVAATGKRLNIPDVYAIPEGAEYGFRPDFDRMMGYRTQSALAVPMQDPEGAIIGVLQLINALDGKGQRVPENVTPFRVEYEGLVSSLASQAAVAIRNARLTEEIQGLFASFVEFCTAAIDARDPAQAGHSRRVRDLAVRIASAINEAGPERFGGKTFSDEDLDALSYAAWLHDIGKIAVREAVLTKGDKLSPDRAEIIRLRAAIMRKRIEAAAAKGEAEAEVRRRTAELDDDLKFVMAKITPGPMAPQDSERLKAIAARWTGGPDAATPALLTADDLENLLISRGSLTAAEYRQVQMHAHYTAEFLQQIPFSGHLRNIAAVAGGHHETLNGTGYPKGLSGDQVGIEARILAVADIFDALTASDRPYKKALSVEAALGILREEVKRGRLDGNLVELVAERRLYSGIQ